MKEPRYKDMAALQLMMGGQIGAQGPVGAEGPVGCCGQQNSLQKAMAFMGKKAAGPSGADTLHYRVADYVRS